MMNVDDVFLILYHHWIINIVTFLNDRQRLQVLFLIFISTYIATRSDALVYMSKNEKKNKDYCINENDEDEKKKKEEEEDDIMNYNWNSEQIKTFCYDNVTLFLFLNSDEIRDLLIIKIDVKYIKEHQKKLK